MALHLTRNYPNLDASDFDVPAMLKQARAIHEFSNQPADQSEYWIMDICEILAFQLEDGSFAVTGNYHMPSDARVDFIYRPSYDCCQALIKTFLMLSNSPDNKMAIDKKDIDSRGNDEPHSAEFISRIERALKSGLSFCCTRNLEGHGIDGLSQQIEAMQGFIDAGVLDLMKINRWICPEFFDLIERIAESYSKRLEVADIYDGWHVRHAEDYTSIARAFGFSTGIKVFIYGTLMSGMRNAGYAEHLPHLGSAWLDGYTLYNLGRYPGIRKSEECTHQNSTVFGELVEVEIDDFLKMNELEGEGVLYKSTKVTVDTPTGPKDALTYVYLHDVEPSNEIPVYLQPYTNYIRLRNELVWYVAYGSNLKHERFMHYLQGGSCPLNGRTYSGCSDPTAPIATMPLEIPYDIYFGNDSSSWGGGVAFLDTSKPGRAYARAYLITRKQYEEIHAMEGSGSNWYHNDVVLDEYAGIPMQTFSNLTRRPYRQPAEPYLAVLRAGLEEAFPQLAPVDIETYLSSALSRQSP